MVREIWLDGMEASETVRKDQRREPGDERFRDVVLEPVFFEGGEIGSDEKNEFGGEGRKR